MPQSSFSALEKQRPGELVMAGEYWAGWFDAWGGTHYKGDINQEAADLEWIFKTRRFSQCLYV